MRALVVPFKVRPGTMSTGVRIHLDQVVPAMSELKGFEGVLVLAEPEPTRAMPSLWETEDDARRSRRATYYSE